MLGDWLDMLQFVKRMV